MTQNPPEFVLMVKGLVLLRTMYSIAVLIRRIGKLLTLKRKD